jgi:hypothetical protein
MAAVVTTSVKVRNDIDVRPTRTGNTSSIPFRNASERSAFVDKVGRIAGGQLLTVYRRAAAAGTKK